jgi:peptidoglycan/LPS O-acetylase OafA/YrhL
MALGTAVRPAPVHEKAAAVRLHSLTGLRALAAGMVFVFHITSAQLTPFTGDAARDGEHWFTSFGTIGVSFFFILSGFVLTWSVRPGEKARRFIRRRLVRIYPNHLVTFAAALLFFAAATTTTSIAVPNLLLVHAWIPDLATVWGVNSPSWSLSCELFFYLCFPLAYVAVRRIADNRLWIWTAGTAALAVAAPAIAYAALPGRSTLAMYGIPVSTPQFWFIYAFPPVRMLEFVLGMLMARIVLSGRWVRIPTAAAVALLVLGFALTFRIPYLYGLNAATVIPLALLIPAAAVSEMRDRPSFLRSRTMVWAGEVSFAFYMVQAVVLVTVSTMIAGHRPFAFWQALIAVAAYGVLCGAAAWALHVCVERPAVKYLSSPRSARRREPAAHAGLGS